MGFFLRNTPLFARFPSLTPWCRSIRVSIPTPLAYQHTLTAFGFFITLLFCMFVPVSREAAAVEAAFIINTSKERGRTTRILSRCEPAQASMSWHGNGCLFGHASTDFRARAEGRKRIQSKGGTDGGWEDIYYIPNEENWGLDCVDWWDWSTSRRLRWFHPTLA